MAERGGQGRQGNPRVAAARLVERLLAGRSLSDLLVSGLPGVAPRDRPLVQELCFGVARWEPRLQALADRLLTRPLKPKEGVVRALILIGLYQLIHMRVASHAAVAETAEAARLLGRPWAVGLVNALLRRYLRESPSLLAAVDADPALRCAFPRWLLDSLRSTWPAQWQAVVEAANGHPPMSLRVNLARQSREAYLAELEEAGIAGAPIPHTGGGVVLEHPMDVAGLPGFGEGRVSVQDGGAQLAVPLLQLQEGQQVLDACAAPGGKSCQILETAPAGVRLTAVDRDGGRLERVHENLARLGLSARVVQGDASRPDGEWAQPASYDRILLDAPCSATGVIRRHPDIKLLRRPGDIPGLVVLQRGILEAMWPLLKPGGILLYATCSMLAEENERQVGGFLDSRPDAGELPIEAPWGHGLPIGRQTLPGEETMDGFYYACLRKG